MKKIVTWLYAFAVIIAGCAVATMLNIFAEGSVILGIILLVVALLKGVATYQVGKTLLLYRRERERTKSIVLRLEADLKKSEDFRDRFRDALKQESEKTERLKEENAELKNVNVKLESELKDVKESYTSPYEIILRDFKVVSSRYQELLSAVKVEGSSISNEDRQAIIDSTINMAMLAYDMADAVEWTLSNRDEQKLNLALIKEEISRDEALKQAIQITDNPTVTPRWVRAMGFSLKEVVSENSNIIYSGYKL